MIDKNGEVEPLSFKKKIFLLVGAMLTVGLVIFIMGICIVATKLDDLSPEEMVDAALSAVPIIDGHNDFAWNLKQLVYNDLFKVNFSSNLSQVAPWKDSPWTQTDLPRLKAGRVGTEFWVALVDCNSQHKDAVMQTMEQIDVLRRLIQDYPEDLQLATESADIESAMANDRIASFLALGGGHAIQSSIAVLRQYYDLGVRSMGLTHNCSTPWVDSSSDADAVNPPFPYSPALSAFGSSIIEEMNRLGMIVDLSHVSKEATLLVLKQSVAPVIFSHSGARSLCDHHRNVDDQVLELVQERNGLVMVGVFFHNSECNGVRATLEDVADHIDYIRNVTSVEHVGIGGHFDGTNEPAVNLEDPSKYPDLFLHLAKTGRWSVEDLEKLSGRNFLRVFKEVEQVRDMLATKRPVQTTITRADLKSHGFSFECLATSYTDDQDPQRLKYVGRNYI